MTEIKVKQRSPEWFAARKKVVLTASRFGDALGVGRGLAIDFMLSLVSEDPMYKEDPTNPVLQHGTAMEEIICEAYQLITGYHTRESGFWVPGVLDTMMKGVIGVSPDGLVISKTKTSGSSETVLGLVEYKAPVHKIYTENQSTVSGIPRQYIAQIQGQMAVTGSPWCDFFAVCVNTKEIMLKRVFFNPKYWFNASTRLKQFAGALKAVESMKAELGRYSWKMSELDVVKSYDSVSRSDIVGERDIRVKDMLEVDSKGRYRGPAGKWLTFDFLVGAPLQLSPELQSYANRLLAEVDENIELASMV